MKKIKHPSENVYCALTNLAKLRIALSVLRDVMFVDGDNTDEHKEKLLSEINGQLYEWIHEIEIAID